MSRSNPNENLPHPCSRWFNWNGEKGNIRYYDKQTKQNVEVDLPFNFVLLDQLATIGGWSDKVQSGIYSNEVKDTRSEPLVVKYFKGGKFAEGLYAEIKDVVVASGGHFVLNCYIAFRDSSVDPDASDLELGSIQFKGAALSAWMEFEKKNRKAAWEQGVVIGGFKEGQKGKVVYRVPEFSIVEIDRDIDSEAAELDRKLQAYLRVKRDTVEPIKEEDPPAARVEEDDNPF